MPNQTIASLHACTPTLAVSDPRGLTLRTVTFHRTSSSARPEERINSQTYNWVGKPVAHRDPRLFAQARENSSTPDNLNTLFSVSGAALLHDNVDAGWRLELMGEAGQVIERWDSRRSHVRLHYDDWMRPQSLSEQRQGESRKIVERYTYAGSTPDFQSYNLCGRMIRHDDTAGTVHVRSLSLQGTPLEMTRRFLLGLELPDWPEDETLRDGLLEAGAGATTYSRYNALGESCGQTDARGNTQYVRLTVAGQLHESRLQLAGQPEQPLVSGIHYNASGQIEQQTAGNGVVSRCEYAAQNGRLLRIKAQKASGEILQDLRYKYDPIGNVLSIEDTAQPVSFFKNQRTEPLSTFSYDTLYQLIEAVGREASTANLGPTLPALQVPADPGRFTRYSQTYRYDAGGNLYELRHVGVQRYTRRMATARHSNRSLPENSLGELPREAQITDAFDAAGNLQALQAGQPLRWDLRNQLSQVDQLVRESGSNDTEVYIYDGAGLRQRKISFSQTRANTHRAEVRYLPGLEIRTNTATGETLHVINVQAGLSSIRVLHWEIGRPDAIANDQQRFSLNDHLGSSSMELDSQARLISHEGFYPYGGTAWWAGRSQLEAAYKTVRYSGKERDATGLYYYGMRYYAPWLQRWINPDPAGPVDGPNLFAMVRGNPLKFVDSTGLAATWSEIGRAAAASLGRGFVGELAAGGTSVATGALLDLAPESDSANDALTAAGAIVGAVQGGLAGGLLARRAARGRSALVRNAATVAGGVAGGIIGALPSVLGNFIQDPTSDPTQTRPNNPIAISLLRTNAGIWARDLVLRTLGDYGAQFTFDQNPTVRVTALNAVPYAGLLAGAGALGSVLPDAVNATLVSPVVEAANDAFVSTIIGRGPDSSFDEGSPLREFSLGRSLPSPLEVVHGATVDSALANIALAGTSLLPLLSLNNAGAGAIGNALNAARALAGPLTQRALEATNSGNYRPTPSTTRNRRAANDSVVTISYQRRGSIATIA
ncbi:putative deoxyribonuclease RhsA [compost metagenome]